MSAATEAVVQNLLGLHQGLMARDVGAQRAALGIVQLAKSGDQSALRALQALEHIHQTSFGNLPATHRPGVVFGGRRHRTARARMAGQSSASYDMGQSGEVNLCAQRFPGYGANYVGLAAIAPAGGGQSVNTVVGRLGTLFGGATPKALTPQEIVDLRQAMRYAAGLSSDPYIVRAIGTGPIAVDLPPAIKTSTAMPAIHQVEAVAAYQPIPITAEQKQTLKSKMFGFGDDSYEEPYVPPATQTTSASSTGQPRVREGRMFGT